MNYRLPKPEGTKNNSVYIIGTVVFVFIVIAVVSVIVIACIYAGESYHRALETCTNNGYPMSYCESMLR